MKEEVEVEEDAKMEKQSDDQLRKIYKKATAMDQSSPANKSFTKRIEKEMKKRGIREEVEDEQIRKYAEKLVSQARSLGMSIEKKEEVEIDEKKAATGYELYHKTFSGAMQHAYAHAKTKGFIVDPKEIDDKVAVGPKKPSSGKTNRYALKAGRKTVHIQVANLDNKRYELNMYIEDYDKNQLLRVKHDEALIAEAGDICSLDRGVLRSKSMQAVWEKKCAPEKKSLNIYNQNNPIGEEMSKDLVNTIRKIIMGEGEGDKKAYQKFFNKALKKFDVKSPAELEGDKKKKFYDYIDKNWVADHEEEAKKKVTEDKTYLKVDLKKLKKAYEKNEDKNNHTENYLLLAKAFGTSAEVKKVQEILKRNAKEGSTSKADNDWMYKNINPYYNKIRNEEVEIDEGTGLQLKMAFDDANIKIKGVKGGKLVIAKKDKKKVIAVVSKTLKKGSDAKKVVDSQITFEEVEKTRSKLFSHVRKLMSK